MRRSQLQYALCLLFMPLLALTALAESRQIVADGASPYAIHHAPDAPQSVVRAAGELRHYIRAATGVALPVSVSEALPDRPVLSIGRSAGSDAAGVDISDVPLEGFRIATRGQNVFILGPDTADGAFTAKGGTSTGTRNGVYSFLEDYVGVRWLMPGAVGEDVPSLTAITLEDVDRTEAPGFLNRRLPYVQNRERDVARWEDRMKLGFSLRLNHGHNFRHTVSEEHFEEHPEWFPMAGGKRVPPAGRYKLETTDPGLVAFFAEQAVKALKAHPEKYTFSVSPSDSGGWSTSPESKALYDTDPHGELSITPLVLDFYINVARQVKAALPTGAVAGYIYTNYVYPPSAGVPPLPDNLYLVIAPSFTYGYTLFRDDIRAELESVLAAWTSQTESVAYYDLMNTVSQRMGAPGAPGLAILEYLFPQLADADIKGVYLYGQTAWGTGAMSNYLLAKLMWDPSADVQALADEYLTRAYGPSAGEAMGTLFDLLDEATAAYYRQDDTARYTVTPALLKSVYGANYDEIERLYLQARDAATESKHRERLAMFEKNLVLFQWNLRKRGVIQANEESPLYRTDAQINAMLTEPDPNLALAPDTRVASEVASVDAVAARMAPAVTDVAPEDYLFRGPSRILILPEGDDEVTIVPTRISARGELPRYALMDSMGKPISTGVMSNNEPIRFAGNAMQPYFLDVDARSASYSLAVNGAPWAARLPHKSESQTLHFLQQATPLYFYVPEGTEAFTVTLNSAAPGETAAAELVDPSGKVVYRMETSTVSTDRKTIEPGDQGGFWTLRFVEPQAGLVDDIYVGLDGLAPWLNLDGRRPLIVTPVK